MRSSLFLFVLFTACSSSTTTPPVSDDSSAVDHDTMDMDAMDMDADDPDVALEDVAVVDTGVVAAATIHVGNFYYKPTTVTVKVGDTVQWIWDGGTHSVTSGASCKKDGQFDSGNHSTKKYVFTHKYTEAGTFPFFCDFMDHCTSKGQEGTVTVL